MSCQEKHGEFFPHERSDLALQNDDFLMDPVIFAFFSETLACAVVLAVVWKFSILGRNQENRKKKKQNKKNCTGT